MPALGGRRWKTSKKKAWSRTETRDGSPRQEGAWVAQEPSPQNVLPVQTIRSGRNVEGVGGGGMGTETVRPPTSEKNLRAAAQKIRPSGTKK